jgi:release factor glutamine methyltransferase
MAQVTKWTVKNLLTWITHYFTANEIDAPRLTAELLLSHVLGISRIQLYTDFDQAVEKPFLDKLHQLVKRAGEHEPVRYIIGRTEFYSLTFEITSDCLIPRPETELLVERAIELIRKQHKNALVCDLCTGCGCIAVAIAQNQPDTHLVATDVSQAALDVALRNVEKYKLNDKITLLNSNLFESISRNSSIEKFDLIVSNPPYISEEEFENLDANVKNFEPKLALLAGVDGLDVYRRIAETAAHFLNDNGTIMLEIGNTQKDDVCTLFNQTGDWCDVFCEKDSFGNDRLVTAQKK